MSKSKVHNIPLKELLLFIITFRLLGTLINLSDKALENIPLQRSWALCLWDVLDHTHNLLINVLFILGIPLPEADRFEDLLHLGLTVAVLAAVILIEYLPLFGSSNRQGSVDTPRAFIIQDVGTDLADLLRCPGVIQKVILDLEVFAEGEKDRKGNGVRRDGLANNSVSLRNPHHVHSQCDGEVE
jgi:hypothetical protein